MKYGSMIGKGITMTAASQCKLYDFLFRYSVSLNRSSTKECKNGDKCTGLKYPPITIINYLKVTDSIALDTERVLY